MRSRAAATHSRAERGRAAVSDAPSTPAKVCWPRPASSRRPTSAMRTSRTSPRSARAARARSGRDPLRNDADASSRFVASRQTGAFQLRGGREHAVIRQEMSSRSGHEQELADESQQRSIGQPRIWSISFSLVRSKLSKKDVMSASRIQFTPPWWTARSRARTASWALRFGRKPYEQSRKSCS